ncbi:MAG: hypothetical protein ACRCWF_16635 [Beijerinckiaceae bacterium]
MTSLSSQRTVDPAEQAALLLFRLGFGMLCILLPVVSIFSRRAMVIIAPIGAIIMISAALLMKSKADAPARFWQSLQHPCGLAIMFLIGWATISLLWTPFPGAGAERLVRVSGTGALAVGAILAMPERMRASNLYLLSVGVGLASVIALTAGLVRAPFSDDIMLERATILITLLAWPAVTWLSMKKRSLPAMAIAGSIGVLAIVLQGPQVLPALLVGAVLLGGAMSNLRATSTAFMTAVALLIMAAPVIALMLSFLAPQESGFGRTMQVWAEVIVAEPSRLLTGHGVETALRNRVSLALDTSAPKSLLFEIWYEFGLLGALATTAALVFGIRAIAGQLRVISPFALGCMGFAFALSVMGLGTSQTWWLTALATTAIAFGAVVNGAYRTERPQAQADNL